MAKKKKKENIVEHPEQKITTDLVKQKEHSLRVQDEQEIIPSGEKALLTQKDNYNNIHDIGNYENQEQAQDTSQYSYASMHATNEKQPFLNHVLVLTKQFIELLFSFITALFPNITDIFKWSIFKKLCSMVRIEHTVFALPFAYIGLLIASKGTSTQILPFILITIAMFGIRSFAMSVNRIVDVSFDKLNPRTQDRELVTGEITLGQAKSFAFVSLCIFIIACALISTQLLALTPIPILFSVLYSYMKRFTWYCHFLLGAVLALAPIAGQLSILGEVTGEVITLSFGILFWAAGFDILYACQDTAFDKEHNLYSIPSCFGIPTALLIAKLCHVNTILFFFLFGILAGLGTIWYLIWLTITGLLLWEHHLLSPTDLSKVNHAFFTINACISVAVLLGVYFS